MYYNQLPDKECPKWLKLLGFRYGIYTAVRIKFYEGFLQTKYFHKPFPSTEDEFKPVNIIGPIILTTPLRFLNWIYRGLQWNWFKIK